jgi:hypothetical protein
LPLPAGLCPPWREILLVSQPAKRTAWMVSMPASFFGQHLKLAFCQERVLLWCKKKWKASPMSSIIRDLRCLIDLICNQAHSPSSTPFRFFRQSRLHPPRPKR